MVTSLLLVINKLGGLYIGAVLVRFLLQAVRGDFRNPLCQFLIKITAPLVNPLRRIIPSWQGLDMASLIAALLLSSVLTFVMVKIAGFPGIAPGRMVSWAFVGLIGLVLNTYFYASIIMVVGSFIAPTSGHPLLVACYELLRPLTSVIQRIVPPMGMFDFSLIFVFLGIRLLTMLVLQPLANALSVYPNLVIGL
jgi:YggT family protein